jgi:beta-glucanase (GH16 family)
MQKWVAVLAAHFALNREACFFKLTKFCMLPIAHIRKFNVCKLWIISMAFIVLSPQISISQTLVWQEEFNSTSLNPNYWTYDFGDGCSRNLCGWGNAELQNYTTRPENLRIENGNLIIEGRRENYSNSSYTSGRIKTEGRIHFKYGTVEARIKIPNLANGLWPAFWTLGTIGGVWPNIGEIDMMEMGSQSARFANLINKQVSAATHWSSNGSQADAVNVINASVDLNNDYHLYKMVWTSQAITMYLDGVSFFTMDISNPLSTSKEEFHNPHFLLLNMAIGGSYTGILNPTDINANMPAQMLVDYVRLYQNPGDVLYNGSDNTTSGNYGVFTETTNLTDSLIIGSTATLNYWNNLSLINGASSFEGNKLWAIRANSGSWFGMGLDNKYINLSAHTNGALKFHFKSSYTGQFKLGLKSGDGESWINFAAGLNQYGLIRDGQWHEVSIPLADFYSPANGRYIDFNSVKSAFMFAGDAPSSTADFYIDNIYFAKNTITPTLGTFTVPSKYLGDTSFALISPTSNSSGVFSYSSSNTAVATISGNRVTIVGAGTSIITASQSPSGNYGSATTTANFVVTIPTPTIVAPVPPSRNSNDYVSLFSNAYTNVSGTDWFPNWGQSTTVSEVNIAGNATKKYENLNYQGVQLSGVINVSAMSYLHVDVWTPNCSSFDVYLINTSPALVEKKVQLTPSFLGWNSFDIPLTQYNTVALNNISQLKFDGTPSGTSIVYFDNLYFWRPSNLPALSNFNIPSKTIGDSSFIITPPTSNSFGSFSYTSSNTSVATISGNRITIVGVGSSVITATQAANGSYASGTINTNFVVNYPGPSIAAPVPSARATSDYLSIYSDAYTNVSGTDFNPYWNQTTIVSDYITNGNNNKKYEQFNYQGIQLSGVINVSGMQYVHIDIWTPNCTGFDLYLINTTPSLIEQKVTFTPTLNGWNSFDVPLSQFNTIALNNISQFKLEARPTSTTVLYWDNLYFWKAGSLFAPTLNIIQPTCTNSTGSISVTSSISGLTFSIDGINYNNTNGVFTGLNPGTYQVSAKNSLGVISSSSPATINASATLPTSPSAISGVVNINQCDTLQTYSVTSVTGVSYVWSVTGTGNLVKSGQGSNTVILVMKVAGTISVKASNSCGLSAASTLSVIKSIPATPVTITYNSTNVCSYTNSAFLSTGIKDTFRVRKVVNVIGYIWEVPGGANYQTINDTTIAVVFPDTITLSTSSPRYVKVFCKSNCDTSLAKSITLTRTLTTTPAAIQTSFVPSFVALTNVAGVDSSIYMIRKVTNATSYSWYLKSGAKAIINHINVLGPNDTVVKVKFLSGFTKDTLCVSSVSGCGLSVAKTIALSALAAPPAPSAIIGSLTPCIGQSLVYKATAGVTTSTTAPTSKFRWTLPSATTTTLISSNSDSSEITVRYNTGFAGGTISVKAVSAVGTLSTAAFTTTLKYATATPSAITASTGVTNFCIGSKDTFKISMPVLTATQAPASVYRWTKPNNTSFIYSNADSSNVVLSFNTGYTGGGITVKSQTACGVLGTAKSLTLTHTGCPSGLKVVSNLSKQEVDKSDFKMDVYPNPCSQYFDMSLTSFNPNKKNVCFELYNLYGQIIKKKRATVVNGKVKERMITEDLSNGIYFLKLDSGNKNIIKIVVTKQ